MGAEPETLVASLSGGKRVLVLVFGARVTSVWKTFSMSEGKGVTIVNASLVGKLSSLNGKSHLLLKNLLYAYMRVSKYSLKVHCFT